MRYYLNYLSCQACYEGMRIFCPRPYLEAGSWIVSPTLVKASLVAIYREYEQFRRLVKIGGRTTPDPRV